MTAHIKTNYQTGCIERLKKHRDVDVSRTIATAKRNSLGH